MSMNKAVAPRRHWRAGLASHIALSGCLLLTALCARAEETKPSTGTAPAPQSTSQPGFIATVGAWLQDGATRMKSGMQDAQQRFERFGKEAQETTKGVTETMVTLPNARMLTGQERCVAAPNGAPDCQAAAASFCRGKGFQTGKIVDTKTEQKCSGRFLLEGRSPNSSDCATEIFVTKAVCQ